LPHPSPRVGRRRGGILDYIIDNVSKAELVLFDGSTQ
jgi:hypothetical protein